MASVFELISRNATFLDQKDNKPPIPQKLKAQNATFGIAFHKI